MRSRLFVVITSWPFLLSLGILLLNDLVLKASWPGIITGKLSDFSGIAVLAMLLLSVLPNRTLFVFGGIAVLFFWWKSPLSEEFIQIVRIMGYSDFGRTVDYTDLIALLVMPSCSAFVRSASRYSVSRQWFRRLIVAPIAATTILALLGTSVMQTRQDYVLRDSSPAKHLKREDVAAAIKRVAEQHGLACVTCEQATEKATYEGKGMVLSYVFVTGDSVSFQISAYPNGLFFGASGYEKADSLRNSLKSEFSTRFRDIEYVESLTPRHR